MNYLAFGASLYVPATRDDLYEIGSGLGVPLARSVIFCTEDAVDGKQMTLALQNIQYALQYCVTNEVTNAPFCFIRPRTPEVLQHILTMEHINYVHGFALPKFTLDNMEAWLSVLREHPQFLIMPILETKDVFDVQQMCRLRDVLLNSPQCEQIAVLRIGGLDLLNLLCIRRCCTRTIYDTALRYVLEYLAGTFIPAGFTLSAPAFECMENFSTLREELVLDVLHGFSLKSAIHPAQLEYIEAAYRVSQAELDMAKAISDPATPPVFRMHDRMCEKSTHCNWAKYILQRAELYGVVATV